MSKDHYISCASVQKRGSACNCPNMMDAPEVPEVPKVDMVNHPPHYKAAGAGFEVIDVIEAFKLPYHLGAVVKYVCRHTKKGAPLEDLKKARWYLDRYISKLEGS
jgi:hypothetical protein